MRIVLWFFIAVIWLVVLGYLGFTYFFSPSKGQYEAYKNFVTVNQQFVNKTPIDPETVTGSDENAKYVKIYAKFFSKLLKVNQELAHQKQDLVLLAQPRKMAPGLSLDDSLAQIDKYNAAINKANNDIVEITKEAVDSTYKLDRTKLKVFDAIGFAEALKEGQPDVSKELQQYLGLSQYVKAILDFVKSRAGYYQLDGNGTLVFTSPDDQAYYKTLVDGVNVYVKSIDDINADHDSNNKKAVNALASKLK